MGRFILNQDLHLHSLLSACSRDPRQTAADILKAAKENGLSTICLTDHYWDSAVSGASDWYAPQNFDHISASRPLPQADGIHFLFGCETDLDQNMTLGLPSSRYDDFDFIVIPTTHLHMKGFTLSERDAESTSARARLWVERLDAVLQMELPFYKVGLAHLTCKLIGRTPQERLAVLDRIPQNEMERLFQKAATLGVGIELNMDDMTFSDEEADSVLRIFRTARNAGCKFYTASDSHHPEHFDAYRPIMERAIDLLGLCETDKFCIGYPKNT